MKTLSLLFICLFITAGAFAQSSQSQDILNKLSSSMKSLETFYMEFNANIKNTSTGINESEKGKGWVKGNKYFATYGEITLLSNGVKTWTVINEEKSVYESDASDDEESMNPKKLMTIWEEGFKNKYEETSTFNGESVHVIKLYPTNPDNADYHTILLYISTKSNALKKAIMKTNDGTSMTYHLTKFVSNKDIADSKFNFNKAQYPGFAVIRD
ncbi:MAG: outer membrane lipoprotein carrier protein LolA [Crocinitomicaceae bacterium]|nr:outer membrane lipoprotein carrier protein LolA [Crocinitomicaceae bacterium]